MENRKTYGFIGLGLIGGSIAKAIKKMDKDAVIYAYDINQDSLKIALSEGILEHACDSIDEAFFACDYIFLCAPVSENDQNLRCIKEHINPGAILTDVGSVKSTTHKHVHEIGLDDFFVGGHPMAGSERFGYANSDALLLENAYYILTPSDTVPREKVDAYQSLVKSLGAIPLILNSTTHDYITAAVSHLPHIIASSLVGLVRDSDSEDGLMKMIAAGGFKDITRIASSSPHMWQQICLTNTENISALLSDYISSLEAIKQELDAHNEAYLYHFFDSARAYRESFITSSRGPLKQCYSLTVSIADETGSLAKVVAQLADHNISIKNIGIVHNREQAEGALTIEFYTPESLKEAKNLLEKKETT